MCALESAANEPVKEREREREREKKQSEGGEKKNSRKLAISRQRKLKDQSRLRAGWLGLLRRDGEADECICMRVCVCVCVAAVPISDLAFFFREKERVIDLKRECLLYTLL